jgi:hypothetical protein
VAFAVLATDRESGRQGSLWFSGLKASKSSTTQSTIDVFEAETVERRMAGSETGQKFRFANDRLRTYKMPAKAVAELGGQFAI